MWEAFNIHTREALWRAFCSNTNTGAIICSHNFISSDWRTNLERCCGFRQLKKHLGMITVPWPVRRLAAFLQPEWTPKEQCSNTPLHQPLCVRQKRYSHTRWESRNTQGGGSFPKYRVYVSSFFPFWAFAWRYLQDNEWRRFLVFQSVFLGRHFECFVEQARDEWCVNV